MYICSLHSPPHLPKSAGLWEMVSPSKSSLAPYLCIASTMPADPNYLWVDCAVLRVWRMNCINAGTEQFTCLPQVAAGAAAKDAIAASGVFLCSYIWGLEKLALFGHLGALGCLSPPPLLDQAGGKICQHGTSNLLWVMLPAKGELWRRGVWRQIVEFVQELAGICWIEKGAGEWSGGEEECLCVKQDDEGKQLLEWHRSQAKCPGTSQELDLCPGLVARSIAFLLSQITCLSHIFFPHWPVFHTSGNSVAFPQSLRSLFVFWPGFCFLLECTGPKWQQFPDWYKTFQVSF